MIRAFICKWSLVDNNTRVMHPILAWFEANEATAPAATLSMHYPDADQDGVPDKPYVLVLVEGPPEIEQLDNLAQTWMLPPWRFSKPVSELTTVQRGAILTKIDNAGIPRSHFAGVETYGDFLKKVAKYFCVSHSGFGGHYEVNKDADFE